MAQGGRRRQAPPNDSLMDDLPLTFAEAAEFVGVSRVTLRRLVEREAIPTHKNKLDGRHRLVERRDAAVLKEKREAEHYHGGQSRLRPDVEGRLGNAGGNEGVSQVRAGRQHKLQPNPAWDEPLEDLHSGVIHYRHGPRQIRPEQPDFREGVFERYGRRCAVCQVAIEQVVQAAHLIAHGQNGSSHPQNGLPLCGTHHLAFDERRPLFAIHPITKMIYYHPGGPSKEDLWIEVDSIAHLPNQPSKAALEERWRQWCEKLA